MGVGHAQTSVEAQTDTQLGDLYLKPERDVDWAEAFHRLGWLARMVERPSIIEPYSNTVRISQVQQCLRKQLTLSHAQGRAEQDEVNVPCLWILSVGDARRATQGFELRAREGWPQGFRFAAPALGLCVIVISELPKERATLPLRLLGRGETLGQAVQEARLLAGWRSHASPDGRGAGAAQVCGRQEGRRLVRRLLEKKFGPFDEAADARFEAADDDTVERYAERMLIADNLAAVFAD